MSTNAKNTKNVSKSFRTIQSYDTSFGGEAWRATSNGEQVNIQKCTASSWRTVRTMTRADYDKHAEKWGMADPYNQNPNHLAMLEDRDY
jgi:hypothetical protein